MTLTHADTFLALALTSDRLLEDRMLTLVGTARREQLWWFRLTPDGVQVPRSAHVDELPAALSCDEADRLVERLTALLQLQPDDQLVLVWERPGRGRLTAEAAARARELSLACQRQGHTLRAQLLSHTRGVMLLSASDYLGS